MKKSVLYNHIMHDVQMANIASGYLQEPDIKQNVFRDLFNMSSRSGPMPGISSVNFNFN